MTEFKEEIDSCTMIFLDFHTPFSIMDKISRQDIDKEMGDLNSTINELRVIDKCIPLHSTIQIILKDT